MMEVVDLVAESERLVEGAGEITEAVLAKVRALEERCHRLENANAAMIERTAWLEAAAAGADGLIAGAITEVADLARQILANSRPPAP
jgi:dihydrodipicolinate synthase/N-acetylneuraminate lyase